MALTDRTPEFLTDDDITTPKATEIDRPDYIGIVCGAQYKLEGAEGVTEYGLVIVQDGEAWIFETSEDDLQYLGRQIRGLVNLD